MDTPNRLLRPDEVGRLIGFKKSKVYALIAAGEIPSRRIGRSVRVPLRELEQWMSTGQAA